MVNNTNTRCDLMMFGALGDLAQRKLFPALYQLERSGLLAPGSRILALARDNADTAAIRARLGDRIKKHVPAGEFDAAVLTRFLARVDYLCLDFTDTDGYRSLNTWRQDSTA